MLIEELRQTLYLYIYDISDLKASISRKDNL